MRLPAAGWRRDLLLALLLLLVAAALRLPRLGFPPEEVFDEVYHAKTALQYLHNEPPTEWVHPPTAKLLIAIGVYFFGYESWAWRLLPALAGIALAPVFYLLARRVLPGERAALLASVLLMSDGVYLVQSRIAMTNIFAVLFQVSAALFILRAGLPEKLGALDLLAAGVCLGLALSTRWTSLWAAAFLGVVLLALRGRRLFRVLDLLLVAAAFAALPLLIYWLSYLPWMYQAPGRGLRELWQLQKDIWHYHATLNATHPYFSKWWTWPWLYRPTWYYYNNHEGWTRGIIAIGNPALWWASVPISVWALVTGLRVRHLVFVLSGACTVAAGLMVFAAGLGIPGLLIAAGGLLLAAAGLNVRDARALLAGAGFFALYLPWGISPRTLNYSHYLFEAIPYACLSLGLLLDRLWDRPLGRPFAYGYVALALALFVLFFPFLTAVRVPSGWFDHPFLGIIRPWTWFPSWI